MNLPMARSAEIGRVSMNYNFDEIIDRSNNRSAKYDERKKKFGVQDVIPLWIADMDFKVAKPIEDALIDKAKQGIFGYVSRPEAYWDALCGWQKRRKIGRAHV